MNSNFETAADLCAAEAPGAGLSTKSCMASPARLPVGDSGSRDAVASAIDARAEPALPNDFRMRASSDDARKNLIGERPMPRSGQSYSPARFPSQP